MTGGTGAGAGDINTSLVTAVPEVSEDTEDAVKTGPITAISPYEATEFILIPPKGANQLEEFKDFSQGPYGKYKTFGASKGIDGKGALFDIFTS